MSEIIEKLNNTTIKVTETKTESKNIAIKDLKLEKERLLALRQRTNDRLDEINFKIQEAKKLGVEEEKEKIVEDIIPPEAIIIKLEPLKF